MIIITTVLPVLYSENLQSGQDEMYKGTKCCHSQCVWPTSLDRVSTVPGNLLELFMLLENSHN